MADPDPATTPIDYASIGEQITLGIIKVMSAAGIQKAVTAGLVEARPIGHVVVYKVLPEIAAAVGKAFLLLEDVLGPMFAGFVSAAVGHIFGTDVSASAFASHAERGGREQAASGMVDAFVKNIGPQGDALEPTDAGARRFLNTALSASMEAWFSGFLLEVLSDLIPLEGIGHIQALEHLNQAVIGALGIPRLSRRVLGPLINVAAVTPLEWYLNKAFRPNLLGAGEVARQVARGRWSLEKGKEELARQGWSDERIEALFNAQRKFLSVADVNQLYTRGVLTGEQARQHLLDQGYDEPTALLAERVEGTRRFETHENSEGAAIVSAYASYNLAPADFRSLLNQFVTVPSERALLEEFGDLRRQLNQKTLSPAEAKACVKAGVLAVPDYRAALRRDGYEEDAVLALELLFRAELDAASDLEEHRRQAELERAAEKQQRDDLAAARKAELDAQRALKRRGDEASLERAVVRGLVPIARLRELYDARYDPDTVDVYVALVEQDRQTFLDEQQRRKDAEQRAAARGLSVADLEQAVFASLLSPGEYRTRLEQQGLAAADADLLTRTLEHALADRAKANADRDAAAAAAKRKAIDLGRFEQLVRRGVRTLPQYESLLRGLGFDDASIAGMRQLLELQIADDTRKRTTRAAVEVDTNAVGLSLEEFRRAVVLGTQTRAAYQQFLIDQHVTADRQELLLSELDEAVTDAAAARSRRTAPASDVGTRTSSVAELAGAARLGVLAPATYQAALVAAGFDDGEQLRELDLLTTEIADVQAARQVREAAPAPAGTTELTLAQLAVAVKRGLKTIDDYRARAFAIGLSQDAAETQVRVLADEVRELNLARQKKSHVESELETRGLSLAELDARARSGALPIAGYLAQLVDWGFADADAAIIAAPLIDELEA